MERSSGHYEDGLLRTVLIDLKVNESIQGNERRREALRLLDSVLTTWINELIDFEQHHVDHTKFLLLTFGSYRMGVHTHESDVDVCCITPRHARRNQFFRRVPQLIQSRLKQKVSGIQVLPEAFVPVIKMEILGVSVDLVFARLTKKSFPSSLDILDDTVLNGCDEKSLLSLNGCRTTLKILQLVPDVSQFCSVLSVVKYWAASRCINSNALGMFGGINLAILVAHICQKQPPIVSSFQILCDFFSVWAQWNWSKPVFLTGHSAKTVCDPTLRSLQWDPDSNYRDKNYHMALITPSFPSMNSTYNVFVVTLNIIRLELARSFVLLHSPKPLSYETGFSQSLQTSPTDQGNGIKLKEALQKYDFVAAHEIFMILVVSAVNPKQLKLWEGRVFTTVRHLLSRLFEYNSLRLRPFPHVISGSEGVHKSYIVIGLSASSSLIFYDKSCNVDVSPVLHSWAKVLNKWPHRRSGMQLECRLCYPSEVHNIL